MVVVVLVGLTSCEDQETTEAEADPRPIKAMMVSERGTGQLRAFPGVVNAVDTARLSFEVAGNIREIHVNAGDAVKKGQVLASLDQSPFELNVKAAEAAVGRAKAILGEKEIQYERKRILFEKGWVAESVYDQVLTARESARNELSYARSQLALARRDLQKTDLVAPFDGVVAKRHVDAFEEVARGEPIFDVFISDAMEVQLSIPESTIDELFIGLPAKVSFPASATADLEGRISEISSVASEANAFPVKVVLEKAPPEVRPGMTAEVSFLIGTKSAQASYLVPVSAIVPGETDDKGYVFVYQPETKRVRRTPVTVGGVSGNNIVVTEGVQGGDIIATAGVSFLRDGQRVRLLDPEVTRGPAKAGRKAPANADEEPRTDTDTDTDSPAKDAAAQ